LIGFVGFLVPHLVRLIFGSDHRLLLVLSAIVGGTFLVVCDSLARSVSSLAIPVGVLTALCGSPILVVLLWRQAKRRI
ncbi:MAG: iron chelate uptake ABC transporter family permease subunit, partial [Planctomycetota bacterium]|nr:iron chelate uptake ABC transporter family permease subunit [Planctomycetota bacterium]